MERGKNYCTVGRGQCNRTEPMSCGGCMTAIAACTNALRVMVGNETPWGNMRPVSTKKSEMLTLYDQNGNRMASAKVQEGHLITTDYRK